MKEPKKYTVKERIIHYLKKSKITQSEFCKRVGLSSGYIGAMRKSFQPDTINKIVIEFPDLDITWLLTGEGEMLNSETKEPNSNEEDMQMKELIAAFRENREMLAEALDQNSRLIGVIERMQGIDRSATGVQKSPPPRISHRNRVNFDCNKEYDKIIYLYNKRVKPS